MAEKKESQEEGAREKGRKDEVVNWEEGETWCNYGADISVG